MTSLSVKEYLSLKMPTEEAPVSDQSRILLALDALGYEHVTIPLHILRILYPMCRDANFDITVTLVHREHDWVVTHVEPGDQCHHHYGLAVDYGSTTILMQLIDLNTGSLIAEEKLVNGQVAYGTDILTRITYCLEHEEHPANLQRVTVETFHSLLAQLTESTAIDATKCSVMVVSGNTTMVHFLLGLNAWTVFAAPFAPVRADPGFLWEKYRVLRNSSLDGARKVLLDHSQLAEAKGLLKNIYCVQFASIPDFLVRMQAAKFIPHTDMNRFPSVRQKLNK